MQGFDFSVALCYSNCRFRDHVQSSLPRNPSHPFDAGQVGSNSVFLRTDTANKAVNGEYGVINFAPVLRSPINLLLYSLLHVGKGWHDLCCRDAITHFTEGDTS
jgi:hypothetical protein